MVLYSHNLFSAILLSQRTYLDNAIKVLCERKQRRDCLEGALANLSRLINPTNTPLIHDRSFRCSLVLSYPFTLAELRGFVKLVASLYTWQRTCLRLWTSLPFRCYRLHPDTSRDASDSQRWLYGIEIATRAHTRSIYKLRASLLVYILLLLESYQTLGIYIAWLGLYPGFPREHMTPFTPRRLSRVSIRGLARKLPNPTILNPKKFLEEKMILN